MASGQTTTLTWRHLGLTRLECDITASGVTTTLSGVANTGKLVAPLDAATRDRLNARAGGCVAIVLGLFALWWTYDSLQRGYYNVGPLYGGPFAILGGFLAVLFPHRVKAFESTKSAQNAVSVAVVLGTVLLGMLFSRWFLDTFLPIPR